MPLTKTRIFTKPQAASLGLFCFQNQKQLERKLWRKAAQDHRQRLSR
jgi:hypothetical protein